MGLIHANTAAYMINY